MFTLFRRQRAMQIERAALQPIPGLLLPEPASALLAPSRRQRLLEHIWQRTSLSRPQFGKLYRAPLERYAELVQQFPASENHHHSYPGGMLEHGLEIVAYALKLRQSHLLPVGAPPEVQAAQAEAWTAAVAYGALLHDVGKIAVDLHVEYADGTRWYAWHGPLVQPYRFRYRSDRSYRLHNAATGLLYINILDSHILDWLATFPEVWTALLFVLAGQYEHAGLLGELVTQADQASVAQDLGGDPSRASIAPRQSLQRKLLDGLRYLLKEELKLNQPQASDGWLTQDGLWLVSKTVCDKLRAYLLSQGMEGIPTSNSAVFDVLQDHGIAQTSPEGKAIWKATVVNDNGWTQSFTFLKVAPALIWDANGRPATFVGAVNVDEVVAAADAETVTRIPVAAAKSEPDTAKPIAATGGDSISDVLALLASPADVPASPPEDEVDNGTASETQTPSAAAATRPADLLPLSTDEPVAAQFIEWLRNGIRSRHLKVNDVKALIHTVAGTVYVVTPGAFQRFAMEHPEIERLPRDKRDQKFAAWEWVQRRFQKLCLHKKQPNGLNIWICEVAGPHKTSRLNGYLLNDPRTLFDEAPPFDNPCLRILPVTPKTEGGATEQ